MPKYKYDGEGERTFPTIGVKVKKGDTFDAPEGFKAQGVSLVSEKSAPAEYKKNHPSFKKDGSEEKVEPSLEVKEEKVEEPSAPSDQSAGA